MLRVRSVLCFSLLLGTSWTLACDTKDAPAKPEKKAGAKPDAKPADKAPADEAADGKAPAKTAEAPLDGAVISETALCEHILAVAHEELGHIDEFDPEVETAAVKRCAAAAAEDRKKYGPVFDGLALCVDAAKTLKEIGSCEDRYTHLLAGDVEAAHGLALDEPIVDSELCAHARKVTKQKDDDEAAANAKCVEELQAMRDKLGNAAIDEMASCVMKATDEPGVVKCTEEAEAKGDSKTEEPLAKGAIEDLEKLTKDACACKDKACVEGVTKSLEDWAKKHENAEGNEADKKKVEEIATELVDCIVAASLPPDTASKDGKAPEKVEKTEKTETPSAQPDDAAPDSKSAADDPLG